MKKLYLFIVFQVAAIAVFAQAPRMILAEEFTQASCGPCAQQNPFFNSLCDGNSDKIIGLHYQVSWPGVDPMNAENATQVASRVSYYGVGSVPYAFMDGVAQAGSSYTGAPYNWTQTAIDNEFAVTSPFTLAVSHTISSAYDSIFISITITAAQNYSQTSTPILQVAVVERDILFTAAPGSNGETDFHWVMRRMLPSPSGTQLATSWTNGQTQTLNMSAPLAWYLRNVNQIGVVAFIQNNATKSVLQTNYSPPLAPVPAVNDAALNVVTVPAATCNPVSPTIALRNTGTATLTSVVIEYQYDVPVDWFYNLTNSYSWTGNLAPNNSVIVPLPPSVQTPGQHKLSANATLPNGNIDLNPNNSIKHSVNFIAFQSPGSSVYAGQDFQVTTFPPADWFMNNPDNGATWTRYPSAGGFGNSTASARMNLYGSPNGQIDELFMPTADLQWVSPGVMLTFSVAYAQKTTQNDRLQVQVSTNCGSTWTTVYDKSGTTLSTHAPYTGLWAPTASDWRSDTVTLDSYAGNNDVQIKFKVTSNAGNNLYLDDVNLQFVTGITQQDLSAGVDVYPNPSSGMVNVNIDSDDMRNVQISIYNSLGEMVTRKEIGNTGRGLYPLNLSELGAGNYVVQVMTDKGSIIRKITLNK
jgi:hypothetical protein